MDSPRHHSDYLSHGLMRLVDDIHTNNAPRQSSGLGQVVCGSSQLAGFSEERVEYCGIDVSDLVDQYSFETVVWLLLTGEIPTSEQQADAAAILKESTFVEQSAIDALYGLPLRTRPLEMLPLAVSMLSYFDATQFDRSSVATRSRVLRILAQLPSILDCGLNGRSPGGRPRTDDAPPSLAGSILRLVKHQPGSSSHTAEISPVEEEAMNAVLICQCLTELRPACFAARFFASTVNDVVPSLRSAASLYVAQMQNDPYEWIGSQLRSFRSPGQAEKWLCGRKDQTIPFGFTLEETDPRAVILQRVSRRLLGCGERIRTAACAERLEQLMKQQDHYATVDWTASVILTLLDVPPEKMSLAIALARTAGWAAQAIDQNTSSVSLLPQLQYAL